jgi:4-aminobutyrate aminotransferase
MDKVMSLIERDEKVIGSAMKIRLFPLVVEKGEGNRLIDVNGKEYIDFTANWGVANTGYCHPKVTERIKKQVDKNTFSSYTTVINELGVELAEKLIQLTPGNFEKKVWFGLSGSDANGCIFKMVPMAKQRSRLVSFCGAYHGQTFGSLSISGHTAQAKFIGAGNVTKIPYPYCYRCAFDKSPENCGLYCLDFLENHIFKTVCPPEDVAGIIIEAIQCDGGDVVPPDGYLPRLQQICEKHGICLVLDEVKIGVGRTGRFFGFEHFNVVPDAISFGKPIASGIPLSGVIARKEILDAGVATHLFTAGGSPIAAAAALATIDVVINEGLMENAEKVGNYLKSKLMELKGKYEIVGDVRGKGLVLGVELVKDRETKKPASEETAKLCFRAFQKGLVIFYVGIHSNVLEFTPPLTLTEQEVDEGVAILEEALIDVINGKVAGEDLVRYTGW